MTDQAPVSGGGWWPQEELSAGRMRTDGSSLRMRRPLSRVPSMAGCSVPAGAAAAVVVVFACWPLDMLGVSAPTWNQMLIVKAAYCGLLGFAVAR